MSHNKNRLFDDQFNIPGLDFLANNSSVILIKTRFAKIKSIAEKEQNIF